MSRRRWPLTALTVIATVLSISACGSSPPASDSSGSASGGPVPAGSGSPATDGTTAVHERAVKFAECIRSNGVTEFPDPDASGQFTYGIPSQNSPLDPSSPAWQKAISACKNLEPSNFMPTSFTPAQQAARLKFAQCVRAHGVPSFPDPTSNGPLIDVQHAHSIPGLQAAIHTCIQQNSQATQ